MKIAGAALERQQVGQWVRLAGFAGAGFLAAGCCLDFQSSYLFIYTLRCPL